MSKVRDIPWLRILAEGTAIVVSILLAFSIQAWWEERQDHVEETAILTSLLPELEVLEELVRGTDTYVRAIRESATKLLEAAVGFDNDLSDDETDLLLKDVMWFVDAIFIETPVLGSLISSGDLAIISNSELRRQLGILSANLDAVRSGIQDDFDFYHRTLMPFMRKHASVTQIANLNTHLPGFPETFRPYISVPMKAKKSHRELLANQEFQNILAGRITMTTNIVEWRDYDVENKIRTIIALIEHEIEE